MSQSDSFRFSFRWRMPLLALSIGLLTVAAVTTVVCVHFRHTERARFEAAGEKVVEKIRQRVERNVYGLRGLRGLFVASWTVEHHEFIRFLGSRNLAQEFPGVRGFGFIQRIQREEMDRFTQAVRADGQPDFTIRTEMDGEQLYVVRFIEPVILNPEALGYDIASEAAPREAAEWAMLHNAATVTRRITLLQDHEKGPGFLYLMPVYEPGKATFLPEQRREALVGWVYAPITVKDLLAGVEEIGEGQIDFEIFDGDTDRPEDLLHDSDQHLGGTGRVSDEEYRDRTFHDGKKLTLGGRPWTIRLSTTAAFDQAADRTTVWVTLVSGVTVSLLVAAIVLVQSRSEDKARRLAREATRTLRESESRFRAAIEGGFDAFMLLRSVRENTIEISDFEFLDLNDLAAQMWNEPGERLIGRGIRALLDQRAIANLFERFAEVVHTGRAMIEERQIPGPQGDLQWVSLLVVRVGDGVAVTIRDINDRKMMEQNLKSAAEQDFLTGLPNRVTLYQEVDRELREVRNDPSRHCALLFLDFDRFKQVNDTLGHDAGDGLLRAIAQRMNSVLRHRGETDPVKDPSLIARIGGDEFIVLLRDLRHPDNAESVADRVLETLRHPYRIEQHTIDSCASVGIATSADTAESVEQLVHFADLAMYHAKRSGCGQWRRFEPFMLKEAQPGADKTAA